MPQLPQPVETHPERVVEDIYPLNTQSESQPQLDIPSRDGFEDFLEERYRPDNVSRLGGWMRLVTGTKTKEGWGYDRLFMYGFKSKKAYAAFFLGVNAIANIGINVDNIAHLARDGVHAVGEAFDNEQSGTNGNGGTTPGTTPDTTRPIDCGPTKTTPETIIHHESYTTFIDLESVGSSKPNPDSVHSLIAKIKELSGQNGTTVDKITIEGNASDEWRSKPKPNIGIASPDKENKDLADDRLSGFIGELTTQSKAENISLEGVTVGAEEHVLSVAERASIQLTIERNGYHAFDEVFEVYNQNPNALPNDLKVTFDTYFGNDRGVLVRVDYTTTEVKPGITVPGNEECHTPPTSPAPPENPPHNPESDDPDDPYDWRFMPIPLLPFPIFKRKLMEKVKTEWVKLPDDIADPEFVKLYPHAKLEDGTLIKDAWSCARKYQNLLRETERIGAVQRLEYLDSKEKKQQLRVIYADHTPTEETAEMVKGMLEKFSQMQGGRLGDESGMIVVYPSDNAGRHGDRKKVGLGLDVQREKGILGLAYMGLGLFEMHMPAKPSTDDLKRYMGSEWVLAHEVAGHGTDLNDKKNAVIEIGRHKGTPVYRLVNRFNDTATSDYNRSSRLGRGVMPLTWRVRQRVENLAGNLVESNDDVLTSDSALRKGLFIRKDGYSTRYGATDPAEHYAEAAAQVATGIGIPFSEEPQAISVVPEPDFKDTYAASVEMYELLTSRWGADTNPDNEDLIFPGEQEASKHWNHWIGPIEDDSLLYELAKKARETPLPADEDLLHIVTDRRFS